ncbi:hypothetical protein F0562_012368 [Nyssa sinensis]|uniref:Uncharacterized protein n=1 Tax=Nyssa sinensis TaxID=561372 RepID=A0A5J4ZW85_9ASTE|nr:hypothetical protein F0562_012368 [Nyssa sinensis]
MELCQDETMAENRQGSVFTREVGNRKKNVLKIEAGTIEQNEEHRATDPMQDHDNVRDPNGQRRSKTSRDGDGNVIQPPPKKSRGITFWEKWLNNFGMHLIFGRTTSHC